jgi:hypothetical protein
MHAGAADVDAADEEALRCIPLSVGATAAFLQPPDTYERKGNNATFPWLTGSWNHFIIMPWTVAAFNLLTRSATGGLMQISILIFSP